jgi:hypothetical protein
MYSLATSKEIGLEYLLNEDGTKKLFDNAFDAISYARDQKLNEFFLKNEELNRVDYFSFDEEGKLII